VAGSELREPLRELDRAGVRVGPEREVGELAALAGRGLGDLFAAVADLAHEEPGQAVQVALAVPVIDVWPGATHNDRHIVAGVRGHAGEVQPERALGRGLQGLRGLLRRVVAW